MRRDEDVIGRAPFGAEVREHREARDGLDPEVRRGPIGHDQERKHEQHRLRPHARGSRHAGRARAAGLRHVCSEDPPERDERRGSHHVPQRAQHDGASHADQGGERRRRRRQREDAAGILVMGLHQNREDDAHGERCGDPERSHAATLRQPDAVEDPLRHVFRQEEDVHAVHRGREPEDGDHGVQAEDEVKRQAERHACASRPCERQQHGNADLEREAAPDDERADRARKRQAQLAGDRPRHRRRAAHAGVQVIPVELVQGRERVQDDELEAHHGCIGLLGVRQRHGPAAAASEQRQRRDRDREVHGRERNVVIRHHREVVQDVRRPERGEDGQPRRRRSRGGRARRHEDEHAESERHRIGVDPQEDRRREIQHRATGPSHREQRSVAFHEHSSLEVCDSGARSRRAAARSRHLGQAASRCS